MIHPFRSAMLRRRNAQRTKVTFGEIFEAAFRKHPLIIGLRLVISGFVAGFGAAAALAHMASPEPRHCEIVPHTSCLVADAFAGLGRCEDEDDGRSAQPSRSSS